MDREQLRDKYRGCMLGLAIGDALGMPVETMTPQEILAATGGAGVTGFLAPLQTRFHSTERLKPGQWTDDTQLSLAIARSLVRKRGFNLADIAAEHIVEYHGVRRGWGESTRIGIAELADGVRKPGEPVRAVKAHGMGNGVAMKVAPLALAFRGGTVPLNGWRVEQLADLTHRDACAFYGALYIAYAIERAIACTMDHTHHRDDVLVLAVRDIGEAPCGQHPGMLAQACERAVMGSDAVVAQHILPRTSCDVRESVPFVFAMCRQHIGSFRDGVLAAVNAGGDTDSNGAMVGAILGALYGASAIPQEWVDGVEARDEIISLADALLDLAVEQGGDKAAAR